MLYNKIIFWFSIFIVFYSYAGYGIFLWLYLKIFRSARQPSISDESKMPVFEPEVALITAVFNEEGMIKKKIENSLSLEYPPTKLKIIMIADGSTDNSVAIISQYPQVSLMFKPERKGKSAAINRAMEYIDSPIVVFCDGNTLLNASSIREIVKHYRDPAIGAVAGEKKVIDIPGNKSTAGAGEGLYWKYESALKRLDASFYTVVGAAGELFSIRTALFEPVHNNILLDDFIMSMNICKKGYRVMYEPKAYASEAPSLSMKDEQKRKIRISAGGFQSVFMLKGLLNIFRYGKLSFQYISHRVLRWIVCPVMLPLIFFLNILICMRDGGHGYYIILILQCFFYLFALIGWFFAIKNIRSKIFYVPYYFLFMNVSLYIGFYRFINNSQTVLWDKAKRKT